MTDNNIINMGEKAQEKFVKKMSEKVSSVLSNTEFS